MNEVLKSLQELKDLTILGVKTALTTKDVALLSGMSVNYIKKLVYLKKIPYYKSEGGKFTYFKKDEVEKWLLSVRTATNAEIEQKANEYLLKR